MASVVRNWGEILRTQNLSSDQRVDTGSRWLLITRASVIPMTITSAAIGGLLAIRAPETSWICFTLAFVGLVLAHAASNMINDYFDMESGVDSAEYALAESAPHPVLSGLVSKTGLILAIAAMILLDLGILVYLTEARGWPVATFALLALFISVFYVAPPLELKRRGLGEPGVFLVWGPLMIGGTYYVTTGDFAPWVIVASLPYAMLVAAVLIGRHVDQLEADSAKKIRTLPVLLGEERSLFLNQVLMISFFLLVLCLVLVGTLGVWTLLVFAAVPKLWNTLKVYQRPPPEAPPEDYPLWPLWYVAWAFFVTRRAGGLFVLGLLIDAIYPIHLS
jgi:1,4-dihydroxy-2-naphthoate octaprenyltransferase